MREYTCVPFSLDSNTYIVLNNPGPLPNCVGCGDCYSNWTLLIEELLTQIADEDSRMSTLVRLHYGYLQPDSLTTNVTTLQSFLGDVRNYSVSVASLNETRVQLLHLLNAVRQQNRSTCDSRYALNQFVFLTSCYLNWRPMKAVMLE